MTRARPAPPGGATASRPVGGPAAERAARLHALLGAGPGEPLEAAAAGLLARVGPAPEGAPEDDPRRFLSWLLTMAVEGAAAPPAARTDPGDEGRRRTLEAALRRRPPPDDDLGQLTLDAASCLARARAVAARAGPGPVLAVGDDDGVTLALALLGRGPLAVVDLDPRILTWLAAEGAALGAPIETQRVDVLAAPLPPPLRRRARAVVTDPYRSLADGLPFLLFGAAALSPGGLLFYADHPAWNLEQPAVLAALEAAGLTLRATLPRLHAYPLDPSRFPSRGAVADALGLDRAWLDALLGATVAVSHLLVLERPGGTIQGP